MTSLIAKYVGKKILGETAKNHFGEEDPYFEQVPATRLDGRPSKKTKRRRKALPPGISERDGKVLTKAKRRAYRLDMGFNICGIKFGWGSILGLIPAIGDIMDLLLALMVVKTCSRIDGGLPRPLYSRMVSNVIFDFVIGLIPFLGDVADALYKCNTRNVVLLERHLREKGQIASGTRPGITSQVDPSLPEEFDRNNTEDLDTPPEYETLPPGTTPVGRAGPTRPQPATVRPEPAPGRNWFGFGSRRTQETDVERNGAGASFR